MTSRLTYTVPEVAQLLGISPRSVYQAAAEGTIASLRWGRRVLIPVQALETWVATPTPRGQLEPSVAADRPAAALARSPIRRPRRRILLD